MNRFGVTLSLIIAFRESGGIFILQIWELFGQLIKIAIEQDRDLIISATRRVYKAARLFINHSLPPIVLGGFFCTSAHLHRYESRCFIYFGFFRLFLSRKFHGTLLQQMENNEQRTAEFTKTPQLVNNF
jgi:hypothetical protein